MDIPILGYLFKAVGKSDEKDEVLIFITPRILKQKSLAQSNSPAEKKTDIKATGP